MNKLEIVRQFSHEPARVFSALTDPAKMSQWFFCMESGGTKVTNDLRPGGKYVVEMPHEGTPVIIHGIYLEVVPPTKLVFTWNSTRGVKDSKVTFELSPIPEGTKLVIIHELPEDMVPEHREGWIMCFENLESYLGREVSGRESK